MTILSIDLGTTYSVLATPDYFEGKYFDNIGGVTLIKDQQNQRLTPSVVAVDKQGNVIVGRRAKARVGMEPAPVMFAKRFMGEAKEFQLGDHTLQPEEVSAEILRYLKGIAEEQLGEPVTEAVITVPAYFTMGQKQKTKEAAACAGLDVREILQEPVAAALAYSVDDTRDPLTVMTYDLGGGTFDVAILRKENGVFDVKEFDGDRHLGGYDFDKRLAFWIADRLQEQGYQLEINNHLVSGNLIFNKLLIYAEDVKIRLSSRPVYALVEPNTGIIDANGEPVSIDLEITQAQFETLIKDHVTDTIRLCHRVLEKAKMTPADLDEIVLVGGSARVPLVTKQLEEALGRQPKLSHPDLSVAIGAAIAARRLGLRVGPLRVGHIPEVTQAKSVQITGTVDSSVDATGFASYTAVLTPADQSSPQRQSLQPNGAFMFPHVPLAEGITHTFTLQIVDSHGAEVVGHRFSIRHSTDGEAVATTTAGTILNVLAKPIAIKTVDGLETVVDAKTALPCECCLTAKTGDQVGEVKIPVYEDTYPIGEIVVGPIPQTLPIGSEVEITLQLREDFYIDGRAYIPKLKQEGRTVIQIPPVVVKSIVELRNTYQNLVVRMNEALMQADRGDALAVGADLQAVLEACHQILYKDRAPNLAKAQDLLAEAEALLPKLMGWHPEPPAAQFRQGCEEITARLLPQLCKLDTAVDSKVYEGQLDAIQQMGEKALEDKDKGRWNTAVEQLGRLREHILKAIEEATPPVGGHDPSPPPDPKAIKLKLAMDMAHLRQEAAQRNREAELGAEIRACQQALDQIDPKDDEALTQLGHYYEEHHQPLEAKVMGRGVKSASLPEGLIHTLARQGKGT